MQYEYTGDPDPEAIMEQLELFVLQSVQALEAHAPFLVVKSWCDQAGSAFEFVDSDELYLQILEMYGERNPDRIPEDYPNQP